MLCPFSLLVSTHVMSKYSGRLPRSIFCSLQCHPPIISTTHDRQCLVSCCRPWVTDDLCVVVSWLCWVSGWSDHCDTGLAYADIRPLPGYVHGSHHLIPISRELQILCETKHFISSNQQSCFLYCAGFHLLDYVVYSLR